MLRRASLGPLLASEARDALHVLLCSRGAEEKRPPRRRKGHATGSRVKDNRTCLIIPAAIRIGEDPTCKRLQKQLEGGGGEEDWEGQEKGEKKEDEVREQGRELRRARRARRARERGSPSRLARPPLHVREEGGGVVTIGTRTSYELFGINVGGVLACGWWGRAIRRAHRFMSEREFSTFARSRGSSLRRSYSYHCC
eukprot:765035-Hanusia_phi.AAC.2